MIFRNNVFLSEVFNGGVRIFDPPPIPIEGLFLGGRSRPTWDELKDRRFYLGQSDDSKADNFNRHPITRHFADSLIRCSSGGQAASLISGVETLPNPPRTPLALSFAFAQQWARMGQACVHGALLNVENEGVLVLGSRAAGKSVLSASVLNAGGVVISDDLLLVGSLGEKILGERMREFISLRSSWASDHLLDDLETEWSNSRTGNRAFLRVSAADSRFRNYSKIDRIWLLSRPRLGRSEKSSICATTHAETYTALVAATQPLLLDSDFVVEKAQLHSLFLKIISSTSAVRIETGQDIVVSPEKTWRRLLAASPH